MPPVLAVAEALLARGHDVTVLSQPSVRARVTGLGCDFRPFSALPDYRRDVPLEEQLDRSVPALVGDSVGHDVVAAAEQTAADAVIIDPNLSGALAAAESLELPSIVLLHSLFRTFVDVWFGELWPLLAEPINNCRRTFGVDEADSWADMLGRHDLIVSPVPGVFDATTEGAPGTIRHVGFLVPAPKSDASFDRPGDEPLVVVSFSTTYQRQERALEQTLSALADEDVRVVVTTSGYASDVRPPANAAMVDFVPHASLFECADLVVSHGGLGTTAAALRAGVPMVCIPMGRDQPLNAERVVALGAGVAHPPEAGGDALRQSVREVLADRDHALAADRVGEASRDAGEAATAAAAIEALLR